MILSLILYGSSVTEDASLTVPCTTKPGKSEKYLRRVLPSIPEQPIIKSLMELDSCISFPWE
jgi:hypothetical protein